jgi:hypothetical protein
MYRTLPTAVKPRKNARPPMPISKPGFEILVPLELLPEYLKVNGLEPTFYNDKAHVLVVKKQGAK